jgi:hypothetical protein
MRHRRTTVGLPWVEFAQACHYLRASTPSPLAVLRTTARATWESRLSVLLNSLEIMTGCSPGARHFSGQWRGRMTHLNFSPRLIGVVLRQSLPQKFLADQFDVAGAESFSSASSFVSGPPTFCRSQAASYPKRSYCK